MHLTHGGERADAAPGQGRSGRRGPDLQDHGVDGDGAGPGRRELHGDAEDEWVGDFTDVVASAAPAPVGGTVPVPGSAPLSTDDDRQAIWDDMLQDDAEREAAAARSDVDEQWSKYLESLKVTKGEIDARQSSAASTARRRVVCATARATASCSAARARRRRRASGAAGAGTRRTREV